MIMSLLILSFAAFAQKIEVKGKVSGSSGESLPGASVVIKGTTTGVTTDINGQFSLFAQANDILLVSYVGYESQEISVNGQKFLTIILKESTKEISGIVVTALGIEKQKSTIGFSIDDVKGGDLVKAREPNAINSLTGRVAGLVVGSSSELLGAPNVLLRGATPLYVIDGVPVQSDTWNINPDDIESYTILKGPTAAALYGSRGQNGAIQITTKRGTGSARELTIDFNSTSMFEKGFLTIPEVQSEYGPGDHGVYAFADGKGGGLNDADYDIWGPRFDGQLIPQYDGEVTPGTTYITTFPNGMTFEGNIKPTPWVARGKNNLERFLQTGLLTTNSIAIASSKDKFDFRFSGTHTYQRGIVPNTSLNIVNFSLAGNYRITKKLSVNANMAYSRQYTPNIPDVTYGPNSIIYNMICWGGADWDIDDMKDYWQPGKEGVQSKYAEYQRYHNPYFMAYEWLRGHYKTDLTGYISSTYKISDHLNVMVRSAVTSYDLLRTEKLPFSAHPYGREAGLGDYREDKRNLFENNTDALLSYDKYVTPKLSLHATAGGNLRNLSFFSSYATTDYMNVPGWYNLNNSKNPVKSYNFYAPLVVLSGYGSADLTYNDFATLSLTGRWDKSSALPLSHNAYFYPSVSTSFEMTKLVRIPKVDFWKLRGSYANVGDGMTTSTIGALWTPSYGGNYYSPYGGPTYQNSSSYAIQLVQGLASASYTNIITNDNIKPSSRSAWETGTDIDLLKNRLGFEFTYYSSIDGPAIFALPISDATGYNYALVNGRKIQRKGVEISTHGVPVFHANGLKWDVIANYSTSQQYLKELYPGEENLNSYIKVGDRIDKIIGTDFIRTPDGQLINDASGRPIRNPVQQVLGYANSDWAGALINKISYQNFSFSFQFDGRFGGTILDYVRKKTFQGGRNIETVEGAMGEARKNDVLGIKSYIGEGVVVSNGVAIKYDADGKIINYDELQYAPNATATFVQDYISRYYGTDVSTAMSRTFVKLREVVLSYNIPGNILKKYGIQKASISFVGRNLLYFAEHTDIDIEQYTGTNSYSGLQTPTTRRFGFNLNLTF